MKKRHKLDKLVFFCFPVFAASSCSSASFSLFFFSASPFLPPVNSDLVQRWQAATRVNSISLHEVNAAKNHIFELLRSVIRKQANSTNLEETYLQKLTSPPQKNPGMPFRESANNNNMQNKLKQKQPKQPRRSGIFPRSHSWHVLLWLN